jgi:sugar lactone lactonase YvrE
MNRCQRVRSPFLLLVAVAALGVGLSGCGADDDPSVLPDTPLSSDAAEPDSGARLVEVATSSEQWTGVTIGPDGRMFVNFPRWQRSPTVSVAEIVDGELVAWPDEYRNSWSLAGDHDEQFICVQSVVADDRGSLWVLDPANPHFMGLVQGGTKLMQFDVATGELVRTYLFVPAILAQGSYLNDVRIDRAAGHAYVTDSGNGAIYVVALQSGEIRRVLDDHPSTEAEDVVLTIEGVDWITPEGVVPKVHADGIALGPDREWLYYQALTGRTMYRVPTAALRDPTLDPEELGAKVETIAASGASDGLIFGTDGWIYISALEESAIKRLDPATGDVEVVIQDPAIRWPDTFAVDPEGRVHFTIAQIHVDPDAAGPYRIFRIEGR